MSLEHPLARIVEQEEYASTPGVLPLGTPRITRSFFDDGEFETYAPRSKSECLSTFYFTHSRIVYAPWF
jgi:hypothetical protein